ncbi:MAG: hypothetical protein JST04_03755 [Bdellovibrionales bacterium]|nr:hypothetical protein [Bdellovibrionales bacterium]
MKSVPLSLLALASAFAIQTASASPFSEPSGTPSPAPSTTPLVTVNGKLQPQFSVQIDATDLQRITDAFASLKKLEPISIDINDLMKPGDEQAIKAATQRISDLFVGVATNIADMRAITYKLAALTQVAGNQENVEALYRAFQERFEGDYDKAVNAFLIVDDGLLGALNLCKSELCAMQIGNAQKELMAFGSAMNQGIKMKQLDKFKFVFDFKASLIRVSLGETFNQLVTPNEEHSAYLTLLGGVLTPFVTAVKGAANVGENLANLIASPKTVTLSLYASRLNPVPTAKDMRERYQQLLSDRIRQIVLNQSGSVANTPRPTAPAVPGTDVGTAVGEAAKGVFSNLVEIYGGVEKLTERADASPDGTLRGYVGLRGKGIETHPGDPADQVNFLGYALRVNSDKTLTVSFIPFNFIWDEKKDVVGGETAKVLVKDMKLVTFTVDNSKYNMTTMNLRVVTADFHPVFQLRKGGHSTVGIELEPAAGYEWTKYKDIQSLFKDPIDPSNPIATDLAGEGWDSGFYAMIKGALTLDLSLSRKLWIHGAYSGTMGIKGFGNNLKGFGGSPLTADATQGKGKQTLVRNDFAVEIRTKLKGEKSLAIFYQGNLAYSNKITLRGDGTAVDEKHPYGGYTLTNSMLDGLSRSNIGIRLNF